MTNATIEATRFGVDLRSELKGNKLVGHAAVFDSYAELPGHLEALHRSAFDTVRKDAATDARCLFNHDPSKLLGRQSSGTLRWSVDSEGLPFEVDLPNTTVGNDVRELAMRGDLTGASIGFLPGQDAWSRIEGRQLRMHTNVSRLVDVSVVTYPAYAGASVMLRSLDKISVEAPTNGREQLIRARARLLLGRP